LTLRYYANHLRKNYVAFIKCCTLLLLLAYSSRGEVCPVTNKFIQVKANRHKLTTEVAISRDGHMCGLAFRRDLAADHGMLFVYARDLIISFWMKNTNIPLSIAFLDAEGRTLEIHNMDPNYPTRRYVSKSPARYALEVNQGWFDKNGIEVGSKFEFDLQTDKEIFRFDLQ